jgi:PmbA protein
VNEKMLVEQLVEKALQRGAQDAQASLSLSETTDVSFENNKLKSTQSAQRTEIQLKVIVDGKAGNSSTTDPADADGLIQRALESAQFGSPVNYQLATPQPAQEVKLYDPTVLSLTRQEMVGMGMDMLETVNDYNAEILFDANMKKRVVRFEFANSRGVVYADDGTHFDVGGWGQLVRGTDIFFTGHGVNGRRRQVDQGEIARRVVENFRLAEVGASLTSGQYPVIFTPDGAIILILTLMLGLDGKNTFYGESPLANRLGEKIADERLTLVDDPLVDYASNSARFDGEGVVKQTTPLIEKGVLRNFLYDLDAAGRAGAKSTGSGPGPRPSNWVIQPGNTSFEQMVKNTRQGLLVNSVLGLGQGNPMNGEFSLNVQEGYKIENGELVGRVKDVMLSGNVYDVLQKIIAIGDKAEWVGGWLNYCTPYIQADGLSLTAK